jgi:hypothetical protein
VRHGGVALLLCVAAALAGCAGTSSVSDVLTAGTLDKRRSGVVVLKAEILGHGCRGGSLTIGKKLDTVYSAVATVHSTAAAAQTGDDLMQVELPPDEYHVINVVCGVQAGLSVTNVALGRKEGGGLLGIGGEYRRSFASFELRAGEIVNVGALTVMAVGGSGGGGGGGGGGGAHIVVSDLPPASLQRFRKTKPNLASQMKTRLMTVARQAMPTDERRTLCSNIRQIRAATGVSGAMPAECRAVPEAHPPTDPATTPAPVPEAATATP